VVGLLAATVAADRIHPILAALLGLLIGVVAGALTWVLVRAWPIIRLIWWWLPEITLTLGLVYGWTLLARSTTLPLRTAAIAVLVGGPAAIPAVRRWLAALAWCVVVRHRLRVCFAQFITANRTGSLPLILLARPTPVGERVWIYLRPGLSHTDLNNRLDKIAVACHASSVLVENASDRTAALVRVDVKRREVLTATVGSPLPALVDTDTPPALRAVDAPPTALDLPDVPAGDVPTADVPPVAAAVPAAAAKPAAPKRTKAKADAEARTPAAAAVVSGGEDISDWI
jgi:hypothetical protein